MNKYIGSNVVYAQLFAITMLITGKHRTISDVIGTYESIRTVRSSLSMAWSVSNGRLVARMTFVTAPLLSSKKKGVEDLTAYIVCG